MYVFFVVQVATRYVHILGTVRREATNRLLILNEHHLGSCWTATRPTTTTADHTKPSSSHHHDRTSQQWSRAARRYVADQSSAA
ncbi:hypothetical protein AB0I91_34895 [Actinosynnema sp. NPDC049800]